MIFFGMVGMVFGETKKPNVMVFLVDDMGVMDGPNCECRFTRSAEPLVDGDVLADQSANEQSYHRADEHEGEGGEFQP